MEKIPEFRYSEFHVLDTIISRISTREHAKQAFKSARWVIVTIHNSCGHDAVALRAGQHALSAVPALWYQLIPLVQQTVTSVAQNEIFLADAQITSPRCWIISFAKFLYSPRHFRISATCLYSPILFGQLRVIFVPLMIEWFLMVSIAEFESSFWDTIVNLFLVISIFIYDHGFVYNIRGQTFTL